jgi:hypothetical protein
VTSKSFSASCEIAIPGNRNHLAGFLFDLGDDEVATRRSNVDYCGC